MDSQFDGEIKRKRGYQMKSSTLLEHRFRSWCSDDHYNVAYHAVW